jgi:glutathionyl-hydroquinone reductase
MSLDEEFDEGADQEFDDELAAFLFQLEELTNGFNARVEEEITLEEANPLYSSPFLTRIKAMVTLFYPRVLDGVFRAGALTQTELEVLQLLADNIQQLVSSHKSARTH